MDSRRVGIRNAYEQTTCRYGLPLARLFLEPG